MRQRQVAPHQKHLDQKHLADNRRQGLAALSAAESAAEALSLTEHCEHDWQHVASAGLVASADAYIAGLWSSADLVRVVKQCLVSDVWQRADQAPGITEQLTHTIWRLRHRNTRRQWLDNAAHHFDIGADFFSLLRGETQLADAGLANSPPLCSTDSIAKQLSTKTGDHVLDLSSDWGAISLQLAAEHGCQVTRVCHSRHHYEHIRQRVEGQGLEQNITVLFEDFRDVHGRYDQIICIDLMEMLGQSASKQLMRLCAKALKPGGNMLLQSVCQNPALGIEQSRASWHFVQRFIHLGSSLPNSNLWIESSALSKAQEHDLSSLYASRAAAQREHLRKRQTDLKRLGLDNVFQRLWHFHLCLRQAQLETASLQARRVVLHKAAA